MADVDLPPGIEPSDVPSATEEVPSASSEQPSTEDKPAEEQPKKKNLYNDEYDLDEDNPLAGSDDEEDDIQVTIGKIEPINVQFSLKHNTHERTYTSKLDIDTVPTINDQPIYDVDLASMEDRPWRKPGADITDYFNYGFTEETWNTYCERQKKLRTEFTSQAAVNKALFSNIYLANPLGMPAVTNRATAAVTDTTSNVKVLTDNGGRFKVHHHNKDEPVMRTVIGAPLPTTPNNSGPPPIDFSKPPPGMSMPPPTIPQVLGAPPASDGGEAPPGVNPPGIEGPPGVEIPGQNSIPTVGSAPPMDMSMPPPGFNPSLPPPGMSVRPPPIGIPTVTIGPPGFNTMMPPPGYNQMRYPMNHGAAGMGRPPPLMGREYDGRRDGGDMDDDRRRRRSRSRSPRRSDRDGRRRDERDDRRDRDRDRKDRDRDRGDRSRRHRSRSREDKRRDRRDDDDRKRRRDRDEEDDRKDRRDRRKKDDRSPDREDRSPNDEEVAGEQ